MSSTDRDASTFKAGIAAVIARRAEIDVMRAEGCTEYAPAQSEGENGYFDAGTPACTKADDEPCEACVTMWDLTRVRDNARRRMRRAADRAIEREESSRNQETGHE